MNNPDNEADKGVKTTPPFIKIINPDTHDICCACWGSGVVASPITTHTRLCPNCAGDGAFRKPFYWRIPTEYKL